MVFSELPDMSDPSLDFAQQHQREVNRAHSHLLPLRSFTHSHLTSSPFPLSHTHIPHPYHSLLHILTSHLFSPSLLHTLTSHLPSFTHSYTTSSPLPFLCPCILNFVRLDTFIATLTQLSPPTFLPPSQYRYLSLCRMGGLDTITTEMGAMVRCLAERITED